MKFLIELMIKIVQINFQVINLFLYAAREILQKIQRTQFSKILHVLIAKNMTFQKIFLNLVKILKTSQEYIIINNFQIFFRIITLI